MKLILDTNKPDVELMETPGKAVIELTPGLIQRILKLSKAARELDVWSIQEFSYVPTWTVWAEDEKTGEEIPGDEELRTEGNLLCVTKEEYWWQMEPKHSDVTVSTDYCSVGELKRYSFERCNQALEVCEALVEAYQRGEQRGGSMEWYDLDQVHELAQAVLKSFSKET